MPLVQGVFSNKLIYKLIQNNPDLQGNVRPTRENSLKEIVRESWNYKKL